MKRIGVLGLAAVLPWLAGAAVGQVAFTGEAQTPVAVQQLDATEAVTEAAVLPAETLAATAGVSTVDAPVAPPPVERAGTLDFAYKASLPKPPTQTLMSPEAASQALGYVCELARIDGLTVPEQAAKLNLEAKRVSASIEWTLQRGAQVWRIPSIDSEVYVYGYGVDARKCGVVIGRPLPVVIAEATLSEMQKRGFATEGASEMLEGGVKFTRLKNRNGVFVDLLDYPAAGAEPGLVKLELRVD